MVIRTTHNQLIIYCIHRHNSKTMILQILTTDHHYNLDRHHHSHWNQLILEESTTLTHRNDYDQVVSEEKYNQRIVK